MEAEDSDDEEEEVEEELGYISPLDKVNPYATFKQALTCKSLTVWLPNLVLTCDYSFPDAKQPILPGCYHFSHCRAADVTDGSHAHSGPTCGGNSLGLETHT